MTLKTLMIMSSPWARLLLLYALEAEIARMQCRDLEDQSVNDKDPPPPPGIGWIFGGYLF